MKNFSATKYSLQNVTTGRIFEDEGWLLDDPEGSSPSLIRARYTTRQIEPGGDEMGIYRFAQWAAGRQNAEMARVPPLLTKVRNWPLHSD